jgi:hypothetical protein
MSHKKYKNTILIKISKYIYETKFKNDQTLDHIYFTSDWPQV